MKYEARHAAQALEIMQRLLPHVKPRKEYQDLMAILRQPQRWKEAHDQFTVIRTKITLPSESHKRVTLDDRFAYVAENAAKTAYNCSGESAPFDEDSFHWLLRCEREFQEALQQEGEPAR
jgi:hypothetical protein